MRRNINRVPRLIFHIKRCAKDSERCAGFKRELKRREHEMLAAEQDDLLKELKTIKLGSAADSESERLSAIMAREFPVAETAE